ncbi:OLC1v1034621C2 [Oldenlandia corymbosa var. corymbosa]|uniref:OLC1v1034621C2 n=2 Tax=Oldenlandia corymbosa var. corymbosa TaxID=529605 RepID=A0AAV1CSB5_OLDCO|nr:OLC1v1034621C2 [Oldenlandia corymbosa var. corymbosa]
MASSEHPVLVSENIEGSMKLPADDDYLLGNLPVEIVQLILSSLSMKEAVKTCLLSTTWSSLWKPLSVNLESSDDDDVGDKMKRVISEFLDHHPADAASMKLKIYVVGHTNKMVVVVAATKGFNSDQLHLDFSREDGGSDTSSGAAAAFIIECLPRNQKSPAEITTEPAYVCNFHSLKTLHLRSISAGLAEDFVSSFLPCCPCLQSLKLEKCGNLRRIQIVFGGESSRLEALEFSDCSNAESMVISAPNLKTLYYSGVLPTRVQLKGTPHLIDVKFDVGSYNVAQTGQKYDCEELVELLANLKEAESLSISGWIIEWSAGVIFGRLEFKLMKLKKLWCTYPAAMDAQKRDSLACFLNVAPHLEMLIINMDKKSKSMPAQMFDEYWQQQTHLWMDYNTVKSDASNLVHLKVIKLMGFSLVNSNNSKHDDDDGRDELLMLMDLLLHKAFNLKSMIVDDSCLVSKD